MDIKEIILNGGTISLPYKDDEKEWMGKAEIYGFSGGFGMEPKIIVTIPTIELERGGRKEFKWNEIDEAVSIFKKLVYRKENLCYKMTEAMIQLYDTGEDDIDLDEPEDLKKVRTLQKKLQKNS